MLIAAACRFATMSRNVRGARPAVRALENGSRTSWFYCLKRRRLRERAIKIRKNRASEVDIHDVITGVSLAGQGFPLVSG